VIGSFDDLTRENIFGLRREHTSPFAVAAEQTDFLRHDLHSVPGLG